jgi:hypothetical protein
MSDGQTQIRELPPITSSTDTRDYLHAAAKQAIMHDDYELIVDMDAHLQEKGFWPDVLSFLENDVLKYTADNMMNVSATPLINTQPGLTFQALSGRIPHQHGQGSEALDKTNGVHPFVQVVRRCIDTLGVDYQVIFPTNMLHLGMNPMEGVEVHLARAYCRWLTERILPEDERILGLIYLPLNSIEECYNLIHKYAHNPKMVGFTICSVRHTPIHDNSYTRDGMLAVERKEVNGLVGTTYASVQATAKHDITSGAIKYFVQFGVRKHPDIPNVSWIYDYAQTPDQRSAMDLMFAAQEFGRPYILPPGVPAPVVAMLRDAFDKTMKDERFLADAGRLSLDIDPLQGKDIAPLIDNIYSTPQHVVDSVKLIVGDVP